MSTQSTSRPLLPNTLDEPPTFPKVLPTPTIKMESPSEKASTRTDKMSLLAKTLAATSNPQAQGLITQALVLEAKQMINEIQYPLDAIMDQVVVGYTIASTLSLLEIGVFDAVPATGSITVEEVAVQCNADEELLVRLMRQLTCVNIFTEVKLGQWAHNRMSIILSKHAGDSGRAFYEVCFDEMLPCMSLFHRYLREFGNKVVHTYTDTPHSWYNKMLGSNFWEVLDSNSKRVARFNRCLSQWADIHPVVAMFPYEEALKEGNRPDRPLMVDIGGGNGQASVAMRRGCPDLQGEIILQDRPDVIGRIRAQDVPGITKMAHDFFTEQPVKNAQVYYIRRVMHDWQDEDAAKIMKAIIPAMAPDSRILLSDMTIPQPASLPFASSIWLDLMLMSIGGKERTSRDWHRLAELTGLKLVKIWQEPEKYGTLCVVEYVLDDTKPTIKEAEAMVICSMNGATDPVQSEVESPQNIKDGPATNGEAKTEDASLSNGTDPVETNGETKTQAELTATDQPVELGG